MIALDTNVVVRFLVRDDEAQAQRARTLITNNETQIPVSVARETERVLRSVYGFSPLDVEAAFVRLNGIPGLRFENEGVFRLGA